MLIVIVVNSFCIASNHLGHSQLIKFKTGYLFDVYDDDDDDQEVSYINHKKIIITRSYRISRHYWHHFI